MLIIEVVVYTGVELDWCLSVTQTGVSNVCKPNIYICWGKIIQVKSNTTTNYDLSNKHIVELTPLTCNKKNIVFLTDIFDWIALNFISVASKVV